MYISSLTPTSRSSKWTLHLLHDPCPTLLWWPPSSLKHKHWKLQWSQVFFIVLLHSLSYKLLINSSFTSISQIHPLLLPTVCKSESVVLLETVSEGCEERPSNKDYREWCRFGGLVLASAITSLYTHQWRREATSHISLWGRYSYTWAYA